MINPKDKAAELVLKCYDELPAKIEEFCDGKAIAKQLAIIIVNEIINSKPYEPSGTGYYELVQDRIDDAIVFHEEVKKEIENL